jgi:hypothetical protein
VSWQQLVDRVVVTFENVSEFFQSPTQTNSNNFQFELFYDGRIRLTFLRVDTRNGIVGFSNGNGLPPGFIESDFTTYGSCSARLTLSLPAFATEGNGTLVGQGQVAIPFPNSTNMAVALRSTDISEIVVPTAVVIPAGQTNAFFDLTILDDAILDGTQMALISATAPQYISGTRHDFHSRQ